MWRTLGTEFLTGLKAPRESFDVGRQRLPLGPREQPRVPPGEDWVLPQCHGEALEVCMVFCIFDDSCSSCRTCQGIAWTTHTLLPPGRHSHFFPGRGCSLITAAGELVRQGLTEDLFIES